MRADMSRTAKALPIKVWKKKDCSLGAKHAPSTKRKTWSPRYAVRPQEVTIVDPVNEDMTCTDEEVMTLQYSVLQKVRNLSSSEREESNALGTKVKTQKVDGEFNSTARSTQEQYAALHADVSEKLQKGAGIVLSLQSSLDATRVALGNAKSESATKLAEVEKKLVSVRGERDATMRELVEQKDRVRSDGEKVCGLRNELQAAQRQKSRVEQDLVGMSVAVENLRKSEQTLSRSLEQAKEQSENLRKSEQAHLRDLEQAKCAFDTVRQILLEDVTEAVKKKISLEQALVSMGAEKNRLQSSLETSLKDLEEENEKALCQICLERRKDSVCFPCLHMQYCFPCLEIHRKIANNNTCPCCRATITDVKRVHC